MKNNKGFSLVELIVVIAIMAILATVAVIGVSVYIPKAQKAADEQMVSDIEQALSLYYQSENSNMKPGYVVITASGVLVGGCGDEAMKLVYGEDWAEKDDLKLAYDGWVINDALLNTALSSENPEAVGNSSYLTGSSVSDLLGNVQTVTGAAAGFLGELTGNANSYASSLNDTLGQGYTDMAIQAGLMSPDGSTVIGANPDGTIGNDLQAQLSNLMVLSVSKELEGASQEDMELLMMGETEGLEKEYSEAARMAAKYAMIKAVVLNSGSAQMKNEFNDMNSALEDAQDINAVQDALAAFDKEEYWAEDGVFYNYAVGADGKQLITDAAALKNIMAGVSSVSGDYDDAETLKNGSLFTSDAISTDVNTYLSATSMAAGLSDEDKDALLNLNLTDGILIFISASGEIHHLYN